MIESSDSVAHAMRTRVDRGAFAAAAPRASFPRQGAQPGDFVPQSRQLVRRGQRAAPQQVRRLLEADAPASSLSW